MKKALSISLTLATLLLLWGCPYQSLIPLGRPIEALDDNMIGSWVPDNEVDKESPSYYVITESDSVHYAIEHYQYNDSDGNYTVKNYIGHTTALDKYVFLNMQEAGHKDFNIHRIEMKTEEFDLYEVTDNIDEKFEDEAEMQKFFLTNMHLSFFYNKDETKLVRKKEGKD